MDFGCHRIEVLLHLMGEETAAAGVCGRVYRDHDVEDTATVAIQFASGASGVVTATRGGTMERDVLCIQGTRGVVQVDNLNGGWLTVTGEAGTRQETLPCHANPHLPLIEAFCDAIREKRPPDVDAETGWRVQRIIDAVAAQNFMKPRRDTPRCRRRSPSVWSSTLVSPGHWRIKIGMRQETTSTPSSRARELPERLHSGVKSNLPGDTESCADPNRNAKSFVAERCASDPRRHTAPAGCLSKLPLGDIIARHPEAIADVHQQFNRFL